MVNKRIAFSSCTTQFYFDGMLNDLVHLAKGRRIVAITDTRVFEAHKRKFTRIESIIIPAGEEYKIQSTADDIIRQLIEMKADRSILLVGIGGGVVTDITGYVASVYMRGIAVGFVPTTILAMVDAAIGGKNGIDVGLYKNIVGTIRQPSFILYDYALLKSLPHDEWVNGFAEVIKHAAIKDAAMFRYLKQMHLSKFKKDKAALHKLIMRNAMIKIKVVQHDEFEMGDRKLLNFGHTLGHAIENMLKLPHGHAISIGMVYSAHLSTKLLGYKGGFDLMSLLEQFELPTHAAFDMKQAIAHMTMDKKRLKDVMHYILLEKNGKAIVHPINISQLKDLLEKD